MCYNGSVSSRNMDYIAGGVNECPEAGKAGNVVNFCNEAVKLNGSVPLTATPLLVYPNTTLTAITATGAGKHTVAFLGTANGALKKVLISNAREADEFEEVLIDRGHPIIGDLYLDHGQKFIYAASPYKLTKVKVERCLEHGNCSMCLAARNPYCGWCSLETRCTLKAECADNTRLSALSIADRVPTARWLSIDTAQCIDFEEVRPEQLPIGVRSATVELIIAQLPPLPYGASYLCVFGDDGAPIAARQTRHGLSCAAPPVNERPRIPPGADHVSVPLAVKSTVTESSFIRRPFVFYECSLHNTCRSCVTSQWGCNWCAHENKCTNDASSCSRKVIAGEHSKVVRGASGHSPLKGVDFCPSFRLDREILIPNGAKREITIDVRNLVSSSDGFECVVEIEGARERVPARVTDGQVICAENSYTYQAEEKQLVAKLEVLWNGDTFIDRTNVTLYKCHLLGAHNGKGDCSLCHTSDRRFNCVWCGASCSFIDACLEPPAASCPPPRIDLIYPLSGPVTGGTRVTIEGSNLGTSVDEIKGKIVIGGVPCDVLEYTVSVKVVCVTGPSTHGAAVIMVGNQAGLTRAQEKFQYKPVHLLDVHPKTGPKAGGSRLYITGSNLNIGSSVEVFLDETVCEIER